MAPHTATSYSNRLTSTSSAPPPPPLAPPPSPWGMTTPSNRVSKRTICLFLQKPQKYALLWALLGGRNEHSLVRYAKGQRSNVIHLLEPSTTSSCVRGKLREEASRSMANLSSPSGRGVKVSNRRSIKVKGITRHWSMEREVFNFSLEGSSSPLQHAKSKLSFHRGYSTAGHFGRLGKKVRLINWLKFGKFEWAYMRALPCHIDIAHTIVTFLCSSAHDNMLLHNVYLYESMPPGRFYTADRCR